MDTFIKHNEEDSKIMKKLFLVDTVVTYRMKYVIEADELSHAYDEITMKDSGNIADEFNEVSQRFLGEQISDGREITLPEYHNMLTTLSNDTNESCSCWMGDKMIRKIKYEESDN